MQNYVHINDLDNLQKTVNEAVELKKNELEFSFLGKGKTICLLFSMNPHCEQVFIIRLTFYGNYIVR